MSRKGDLVYFGQMLDTVRRIEQKTAGLTRGQFDTDEDLRVIVGCKCCVD
jgi:hypothetical protein